MTLVLHGLGVSPGVVMGRAYILHPGMPEIAERPVAEHEVDAELERLQRALDTAAAQLEAVRAGLPLDAAEVAAFIEMDLLMLRDEVLVHGPAELIRQCRCNAEWALKQQGISLMQMFDAMEDDYIRSRRVDVEQLVRRVQRILLQEPGAADADHHRLLAGRVVVAEELIPGDAILLHQQGAAAFVTAFGGPTSHTAILAHTLGVPAVSGLHHAAALLRNDEPLIVDGAEGVVLASADEITLRHYRRRRRDERRRRAALGAIRDTPAVTRDGVSVDLQANIEFPEDVTVMRRSGATAVGLYRTEFLFMNRPAPPSEEEQFRVFVRVLRALRGAPLTIRTLDLGADKPLPWDGEERLGPNPALGLRAIRLCLKRPELFRPQLRAVLRASAHGPVRLMIPMMTSCQEILQVHALLDEVRAELRAEGHAFDPRLPVGAMIEVPAAALAADLFARHMDFLSIGTNDLIQYTLAADRVDDAVSYLYDPLHPGVLQLIQRTLEAAARAKVPVAMCGEMAGDPRYTRLLLGMGLRAFSVHPCALPEVKHAIRHADIGRVRRLTRRLLRADFPEDMQALLGRINAL
ncbi:phosphoenolpyruvate--protein phosphotransferase [Ectothiorhodospiraceae bacterium 2226]|nr:phosphoenolpyruvate--protein phosphotransferase [Ectothiorhodospiraceae bacterium 2226]